MQPSGAAATGRATIALVLATGLALLSAVNGAVSFPILLDNFWATQSDESVVGWLSFLYMASPPLTACGLLLFAWMHPRLARSTRVLVALLPTFHSLSAIILPMALMTG